MLENGLIITVVGMGVVFTFLSILVCSMLVMAKVMVWLNKIYPEPVAEIATVRVKNTSSCDEEIAVAIAAVKALS